jgi:broad specificity phosphatase PhoE
MSSAALSVDPRSQKQHKTLNIYCSTLKRTIETAGFVYKQLDFPTKVVKWRALAEINAGMLPCAKCV